MRRIAPRRAVLLVATLALSTIAPGFFAPVRATDLAILQGSIRSVAGEGIAAEVTLLTSDGTLEDTSPQLGDTFALHSAGGPHILRFATPSTAPASATTLPATWSFEAPYLVDGDDLDIDVTLPDSAPADIVVLGLDGQPVSDATMTYSAVTEDVDLGAGLTAQAIAAGDVADDYPDGS